MSGFSLPVQAVATAVLSDSTQDVGFSLVSSRSEPDLRVYSAALSGFASGGSRENRRPDAAPIPRRCSCQHPDDPCGCCLEASPYS